MNHTNCITIRPAVDTDMAVTVTAIGGKLVASKNAGETNLRQD
jgi:hypothetical protein